MLSNLDFGFKVAAIGIPLVFLSLGAIAILFELLKRKFKAEKIENKSLNKELITAIIAAVCTAATTQKETLKFQKELRKESVEWSSTPIWNLAGRLELTSKK
ncbi:hypothetical protein KEJ50_01610 [Candidatus Bathyarchaeota archaeon]|nr:hypothetical protein [Candidatus Bathyarchaeota archaeon]